MSTLPGDYLLPGTSGISLSNSYADDDVLRTSRKDEEGAIQPQTSHGIRYGMKAEAHDRMVLHSILHSMRCKLHIEGRKNQRTRF